MDCDDETGRLGVWGKFGNGLGGGVWSFLDDCDADWRFGDWKWNGEDCGEYLEGSYLKEENK